MRDSLLPQRSKVLILSVGLLVLSELVGCAGGSGSSESNGSSLTENVSAITIDNAGVIPVFGDSSTSTVVYVHNNGKKTISGISYNVVSNEGSDNIGGVDGRQCVAIAAYQSCALKVITPNLSLQQSQGSMLISAAYTLAEKTYSFSQVVNYAQVQNNLVTAGAKFQSGVTISGYGNSMGYATIYLYGSGQGQVYNVSTMIIDKPAITIVSGNISGHQIQSNFVQAVEVSSPISTSSISATITANSSALSGTSNHSLKGGSKKLKLLSADQFSNSADLVVGAASAGAILTTGLVPLINTVNGASGSMLIQNTGNQAAVVGSVSADAGISNLSGCSGETLVPAGICTISFNVTESGGSGNITVPYTGGSANSVVGNVTWFSGESMALASMSASSNPLSFSATVGGSTTVTVTNIGGYTLSGISIPAPIVLGGSASATLGNNNCISTESLAIGDSCTYDVAVADSATDLNQQVNLGFNASYAGTNGTQIYSRVMPLIYSSTSYGAIITLSTLSAMSISGDSLESVTQSLIISNNGAADADLTSLSLINNPTYLTANSNECGSSLAAKSSCNVLLKLGPTYSYLESSGVANYVLNYAAVGQTPAGSESSSIIWSVTPNLPSINMVASVVDCASGDGITTTCMDNPTATGGTSSDIQLILTFTNTSRVTAASTISLSESSSELFSVPGYTLSSNSCTNGAAVNNGSCTMVYSLPSSASTEAFQSNLSQANFAYNYTYGTSLSASSVSNLQTMIDVVLPTLSIDPISVIIQGESKTATISWGNLYQATVPTTVTSVTGSDGSSAVTGMASATPATCNAIASNTAACTSLITSDSSTPLGIGYLLNVTAVGGVSATPDSFNVLSSNVIFVTSGTWDGSLGGFPGADSKCNADVNKPSGNSAGAGKAYKALLSGNNATTNGVTYYRTDGTTPIKTATGGNLVGSSSLDNAIRPSNSTTPWTGSVGNCSNWAASSGMGSAGISSSSTSTWWASTQPVCSTSHTLYCVAQ